MVFITARRLQRRVSQQIWPEIINIPKLAADVDRWSLKGLAAIFFCLSPFIISVIGIENMEKEL